MKKCSNCRKQPARPGQRYCNDCHASWMRFNRPMYAQFSKEQRKRSSCRSYANVYLQRGKIQREDCKCGEPGEQMHHDDYDKPLEIEWMCKSCHINLHNSL